MTDFLLKQLYLFLAVYFALFFVNQLKQLRICNLQCAVLSFQLAQGKLALFYPLRQTEWDYIYMAFLYWSSSINFS